MALKSTVLTSNGAVKAGPGAVHALVLAAGSDTATATLYDNTAGSGTKLIQVKAYANNSFGIALPEEIVFSNCYCAMTGTSPTVTVVYR